MILLRTSVIYASYVEMIGLIGAGNNPMVGMTVAVAVAIEEAQKQADFSGEILKKAEKKQHIFQ